MANTDTTGQLQYCIYSVNCVMPSKRSIDANLVIVMLLHTNAHRPDDCKFQPLYDAASYLKKHSSLK